MNTSPKKRDLQVIWTLFYTIPPKKFQILKRKIFQFFGAPEWLEGGQKVVNFSGSEWKLKNRNGDAICIHPRYLPLPQVKKLVQGYRL